MTLHLVLFCWVLRAMIELAPGRNHTALASAITTAALEQPPLFRDDPWYLRTVSTMTAVSFRESGFVDTAVGDHGESFGAFQQNSASGGSRELLGHPLAQARMARRWLGLSVRACPEYPIAHYASGPGGCTNARAQRISRDRMSIAAKIAKLPSESVATSQLDVGDHDHQ